MYVSNGERGFPKDANIGFCLDYEAFKMGDAMSASAVARRYRDIGRPLDAITHFGVAFGYGFVLQAFQIKTGAADALEPRPGVSHYAWASYLKIVKELELDAEQAAKYFSVGVKRGVEISADVQRTYGK